MRRACAIWAALLAPLIAAAPAAADVVSRGPSSVAVTVYRDDAIPDPAAASWRGYGLAMISETREVTLPVGDTRLVLEGVTDGIIAQTASLAGFPGRVLEQNFDDELLSPATLIEHSVGREVEVSRTNPRTGKVTLEPARLASGPHGVLLDFGGGRIEALGCSGGPEGIVLDGAPPDLTGKPTLSIRVHVDKAGAYRLRLAYITVGLAWRAAYVARLAPDGRTLALTGWITLANHGDVGYANAAASVVAGRLARNAVRIVRPLALRRESACWPQGNSHHPVGLARYLADVRQLKGVLQEVVVTAQRRQAAGLAIPAPAPPPPRATQSDLGDYKLYTLNEPTTVAARQTKQVTFLSRPAVTFDTVQTYRASFANMATPDAAYPTVTTLRFDNTAAKGLGLAMPAGQVVIMAAPPGGSDRFLGAAGLRDVPVGEPFDLEVGRSHEVTVRDATLAVTGGAETRVAKQITAINASARPATVEIRQPRLGRGFRIVAESAPHGLKSGDPIWRLTLAPGKAATVTYAYAWRR